MYCERLKKKVTKKECKKCNKYVGFDVDNKYETCVKLISLKEDIDEIFENITK